MFLYLVSFIFFCDYLYTGVHVLCNPYILVQCTSKYNCVTKSSRHGCFIPIEPVTKRLRPVIRNFFIATDLITTLATNMGLKMLPFTTRTVLNSSFDFGSYFYIVWRSEQCELMPLIFCRYYVIRSRILCVLFEVR